MTSTTSEQQDEGTQDEEAGVSKITRFFTFILVLIPIVFTIIGAILGYLVDTVIDSEESAAGILTVSFLGFGLGLSILFLASAWRFYDPFPADQVGFRTLFGEPIKPDLKPGIPYAPLFITEIISYPLPVRQRQFPAEDHLIFYGEYKDGTKVSDIPPGMRPPIRITFAEGTKPPEVKKKVGAEDLVSLDLFKMDPLSVKAVLSPNQLRREIEVKGNCQELIEKEKLTTPISYWGEFEYPQLRRLEEMGIVYHELDQKNNLTEKEEKLREGILDCLSGNRLHTIPLNPRVTKPDVKDKEEESALIGLERRITASLILVVRWTIVDPVDFYRNIGSDEAVNKQIEDEMVSVISRLLPRISAGIALQNIAWINAHLYMAVIKRTLSWGVRVENTFVKNLGFNHALNDAIAALPEADYRAQSTKIQRIREGEGIAQAAYELERRTLEARGAGMRSIVVQLNEDGEVVNGSEVQAAEVARDVADGGNTIVVGGGGMNDLVGLAAAAVGNTRQNRKQPPETNDAKGDEE